MGIFNRAIPNIQTNNLNQVRVVPQEDYYVDDIFDPLFNAKVKEQLTLKYGNPFLGTVGGYMEGIDNALLGQDGKWGILGPGMGILSGFGRSMDKAGDFIIGGVTEGVKGLTGQGFENPLRNIFVEDEDYTGTRLLAAMGNSMAGLAKAPQLNESDFKGLWNIPAMGLELATDPGILGGGIKKAASVNLGEQVAKQSANSHLADVGQLLMDYDDLMAKVSMDLTAPGLRISAKALLDKIQQKLANSSFRQYAQVKLDPKETPEARAQADDFMQNDAELGQTLGMEAEVRNVIGAIDQANLTKTVNTPNLNAAQVAVATATTVPTAVQEELARTRSEKFKALVDEARQDDHNLIRKAYFTNLADQEAFRKKFLDAKEASLNAFRNSLNADMAAAGFSDGHTLDRARNLNLLNIHSTNLTPDIPDDIVSLNNDNYQKIYDAVQNISGMSKDELNALNINPEYVEQIDIGNYQPEDIAAGMFYDFVPNESTRNAILRYAGVDIDSVRGLQLDTPITFSPSDYAGISDSTLVEGLKTSEMMLYDAFESAGVSLRDIKSAKVLDKVLSDPSTPQGKMFRIAFPEEHRRQHLIDQLGELLFPEANPKAFKHGAVEWLNRLDDFSNEIITYSKLRNAQYTPLYESILEQSDALGISPLELISKLREKTSFTDWLFKAKYDDIRARAPQGVDKTSFFNYYLDGIRKLEALYGISEHPEILEEFIAHPRAGTFVPVDPRTVYEDLTEYENLWQNLLSEHALANNPIQSSLWFNLHDVADTFQREIHRPFRRKSSVGYIQNSLEFKDSGTHGVDLYGRKVSTGGKSAGGSDTSDTFEEVTERKLESKHRRGEKIADVMERSSLEAAAEKTGQYVDKKYTPKDDSKAFKKNLRTDFGKRNTGYAGDADTYQYHRTLINAFRKDPHSFQNVEDFIILRDEILPNLAKNYQTKLRSNFFFKDVPSSTRVKDLDTSKLTGVSKLIIDEGREAVAAFNREVKPVAEALLKDGINPWIDPKSFVPRITDEGPIKTEAQRLRALANQKKMQNLLGFSDTPHPLYKEFRVIKDTLPVKEVKYGFKTPDANWSLRIAAYPQLRYALEQFPILRVYRNTNPDKFSNLMSAIKDLPFDSKQDFQTLVYNYIIFYDKLLGAEKSFSKGYAFRKKISYDHLTINDFINIQNAKFSSDWRAPVKVPNVREAVSRIISDNNIYSATSRTKPSLKSTDGLTDALIETVENASAKDAAEIIDDMPSYTEAVEAKVLEELDIPAKDLDKFTSEPESPKQDMPRDPSKTPREPGKPTGRVLYPKQAFDLKELVHNAMSSSSRVGSKNKPSLRTKFVQDLIDDADLLAKKGITDEAVAKYKRAQIYLGGAAVRKEEFLDAVASSGGSFMMAYKPGEDFSKALDAIRQNVAEVNVAMKANVLTSFQRKLSNGNTVIGVTWDTSNRKILNALEKGYKNLDTSKLKDIVRLEKGTVTPAVAEYLKSDEYRILDDFFNRVRQGESEYAKLLGFKYDDAYHVKNVKLISPDVANYLSNIVYKDMPMSDLEDISDKAVNLDVFKHLRGSWGSRKFDKRFIGYIEDFEADGLRIFDDKATNIVKGSLAEGSFNNSQFQTYIDLIENDNFKLQTYFSSPEDLEKVLYARLEDGTPSGNLTNLVLAAPRKDATGRVIGFTQFDKTTRAGLQSALNNPEAVMLPAHIFSPLDRILRKDAKMSNKIYAFIHKHLTLPFKFGVLMNPGFLIGNASDAYLKQATTMAQKYGTSTAEELANVSVAVRDVLVLNNKFDDAYRRFLAHIQAEGFTIAPSNQISSLAATDPRIRKMLKDYVKGKLQKSAGHPLIDCKLSAEECNTVRLWLLLNSTHTASSFDSGFQDLDIFAKAKNTSKYQVPKNPIERITMGKGEYQADDISTWGLYANNPLMRAIMDGSESIENVFRASCILNDFRHKGMDSKWFSEYFDSLDELSKAAKTRDPGSIRLKEELKKNFNVHMSESINTMHHANFDYERMTDFTDTVGTFVPFPTFFLKNLGYWLEILVNNPQYIDHAITVQEGLWGSRDTSKDQFAAEAKGRGAIPVSAGGQNLSKFFKGIYKPTPLQSMFGAFSLINNPLEDMYYRLHPALSSGITTASQVEPLKSIAADVLPSESVKYRPYSTDMYERNVKRGDPNFNPLAYSIHRANPMERATQSIIRLPDKLRNDQAQLSDFLPSIFQPDFGEKYSQ